MTYFKDGLLGGSHNFKFGGELLMETGWFGYEQAYGGNIRANIGTNGQANNVFMAAPTATQVGSLGDGPKGNLLSISKLNTIDAFMTDQYTIGRATFNLGVRWDHYNVFTPEQRQLAYTFPAVNSPLSIPAQSFPETHYLKWDGIVPRLGVSYDLMGDGKTVLKANWGLYKFNPGVGIADQANPNQSLKTVTYSWTDRNLDGKFQPGEEGTLTASALAGSVLVDPNLKQPGSTQATVYLERQLMEGVGARVGFVYYSVHDQTNTYQNQRPASAYTVPFTFVDRGPDNVLGNGDDQNLTFFGIPSALVSGCNGTVTSPTANCQYPTTQMLMNQPANGNYKTVEFSVNKRQSHNYSLGAGFGYTWQHDFPVVSPGTSFPNTPNGPFDYDYRSASFKVNGMYNAPWGI